MAIIRNYPNREDTMPITPYESTPEKDIVKLNSIQLVNDTTIRLYFSTQLKNTNNLLLTSTYSIVGPTSVTITSVTRYKQMKIDLTVSGLLVSGIYTVKVVNPIEGINGIEILKGSQYREKSRELIVQRPRLNSATASGGIYVTLLFNEAMENNAALTTPANYVISGATVITVSTATRTSSTTVRLLVSQMLNGGAYLVTVSNVQDLAGNIIDPAYNAVSFVGISSLPEVSTASARDYNTIRVVFSKSMENNAALTNTANYIFSGITTLTAALATRINSTTVDIDTTEEMRNGGNYTITVSNVTDTGGNALDPLHASANFTGIGVRPRVSSAAYVNIATVDVVFDESVEQTSMETPGNYGVTGISTLTVSAATRQSGTTVRLTTSNMVSGDYTVTVANVTDLAGNVIDPSHNTANYTAVVSHFSGHPTLENDLLAYYKFDSGPNDSTTNAADGTLSSAGLSLVAGKISNCYSYNGVAGTILVPTTHNALFNTMTDGSVSAWCLTTNKTKNPGQWFIGRTYYDGANGYFNWGIVMDTTGNLDFYWNSTIVPLSLNSKRFLAAAAVSNSTWYHLVAKWEWIAGPTFKLYLYVDNVEATTHSGGAGVPSSTVPLRFGARSNNTSPYSVDSANEFLVGNVDEVGIWDRALTVGEINDLYNGGAGLTY